MATFGEETFGPAASIIAARDADEAIRLANLSRYDLSSALWTGDTANARAFARRLETGGVFINGVSPSDPRLPDRRRQEQWLRPRAILFRPSRIL
jgi:succinate-semialdehyde dehydrogenase